MDRRSLRPYAVLVAFCACALPVGAWASGFEFPDNGTAALSRGGSFAASADDGLALHYNPAGLAFQKGARLTLGSNFVNENLTFTRSYSDGTSAAPVSNQSGIFPAPHFFLSHDFGLRDWTFGLGVYGPSAVGKVKFPATGASRYMLLEEDMLLAFLSFAASWSPTPELAVGATFQWMYMPKAFFSMTTGGYFNPNDAGAHCDNPQKTAATPCGYANSAWDVRTDIDAAQTFAPALRLGGLYRPGDHWSFALAGRVMPIDMVATGKVQITPSPAMSASTKLTHEKDGVTLSLKMPWTAVAGARYAGGKQGQDSWDVELNVTYEAWKSLDAFRLKFEGPVQVNLVGNKFDQPLADVAIQKQYQDVWGVRLGGSYPVARGVTLRAGTFYESAAVKQEYTNLDFIGWERVGLAAGLSWKITDHYEVAAGYEHILQPSRTVTNSQVREVQALSPCQPPYTAPQCKTLGKGLDASPPIVGNGLFESSFQIASVSIIARWGAAKPAKQPDAPPADAMAPVPVPAEAVPAAPPAPETPAPAHPGA